MKALTVIVTILWTLAFHANAQSDTEPCSLEITFNKTSSLVFQSMIASVDLGSRDILAQKAKGVENVLQLKAARQNFPETNLTVITADGTLHLFTVNYSPNPAALSFTVREGDEKKSGLIFDTAMTESALEHYCTQIIDQKHFRVVKRESKYKMTLTLNGVYVVNDIIFYHFTIKNKSNLNYDVDFLRLFIEDKARIKRTASQAVDVKPLCLFGNAKRINANSTNNLVIALDKFTIPNARQLMIELYEQNGGRNLNLAIGSRIITNALPVR